MTLIMTQGFVWDEPKLYGTSIQTTNSQCIMLDINCAGFAEDLR